MATSFNSLDQSPLGAFVESPLGARNGNVSGAFIIQATIDRGSAAQPDSPGTTRHALLRMGLPDLYLSGADVPERIVNVLGVMFINEPIRPFGGRGNSLFRIDRGDLVKWNLDWRNRTSPQEVWRMNAADFARAALPPPPTHINFIGEAEWTLSVGDPTPVPRPDMRVGNSFRGGRFVLTMRQFGRYLRNYPGGTEVRTLGSIYRAVTSVTPDVQNVTHILAAATNDTAPFWATPTNIEGAPQHLSFPIDTWVDEGIARMRLDSGEVFSVRLADNLITWAGGGLDTEGEIPRGLLTGTHHPRPGWSTLLYAQSGGTTFAESYFRGTWRRPAPESGDPPSWLRWTMAQDPDERAKWRVKVPDPIHGWPRFIDPSDGLDWTIRKLHLGMMPE